MDQQQRVVKFEVEAVVQYGNRDDLQMAIRRIKRDLQVRANWGTHTYETRDVRVTGKG